MKARVVVFDLGKVLLDFDYGIAARKLAERAAVPDEEVRCAIDQSPLLYDYERAAMTDREFFERSREAIGYRGSFEEFADAFANIFTEIPSMIALQKELQAQGIPTCLLSNTNGIAMGHIRRQFPFLNSFTAAVLSYEHSLLKPERRIYEVVERLSGARGAEILFIDDRRENVEGAQSLGWQTIWHQSAAETVPLVRQRVSSRDSEH